jgi:hypothetical protein
VADADGSAAARALRDGLRAQREIYAELEDLTSRQGEILLGGRTEEILALARAKESTLARIDAIEARISAHKRRWSEERDRLPASLREAVQSELDLLHVVLGGLIALEGEQQRRVETVRRETADQLRRIEGGRRVHQAYGAPTGPAPAPRYLDRTE